MKISRPVTVSVVSHGHGMEVLLLVQDLARQAADEVERVVVTLNLTEELLARDLQSQLWPFEVVITRNAAPLGFGANHNQAFDLCKTSFFCVVNPDIRLPHDPFPSLLGALETPAAGCSYPMQGDEVGGFRDLAREMPTPIALLRRNFAPFRRKNALQSRDWVNGSFMLFSTRVYALLNGFDQRFFMYCEDVELCLRLQQQGFRLIPVSEARVNHRGGYASRRQLNHLMWHLASLARLWTTKSYWAYRAAKRKLASHP